MKLKMALIVTVLVVGVGGAAYFLFAPKPTPMTPPPSPSPISQDQLQGALQDMVTRKAEKRGLQTQLAVYEKLLQQLPDNPELQRRAEELRQRIRDLESKTQRPPEGGR